MLRNPYEIAYNHYQCFSIDQDDLVLSKKSLIKSSYARLLAHYFKSIYNNVEWERQLSISAALGNVISQYEYGFLLIYQKRVDEGIKWLIFSADQGYIDAIR